MNNAVLSPRGHDRFKTENTYNNHNKLKSTDKGIGRIDRLGPDDSNSDGSISADGLNNHHPGTASMANPDDSESLTWGTLEELLLACAVHRYGTDCWDSVAKEIQKRSSRTFHLFSSQRCRQKYYDLKRRFAAQTDDSGSGGGSAEEDGAADAFPWLDELRRRRIAELKRELQRYDLSIVSLQSTVKRLSEEREKSLTENVREVSDLQKTEHKKEEGNRTGTSSLPLPESGADDGAPADESDRENHSVNAANNSDPKGEKSVENGDEVAGEENPVEPAADSLADPEEATDKPAAEDSYNGSSDTIAAEKGPAGSQDLGSAKTEPVCDSPELVESVAESKREGDEERMDKEAIEVQSSASLSEKKVWGKTIGLSNSGEEAENQFAAAKPASVKSQPMADFLEAIRRHKFGSVFERRLDSQESSKYRNMIRQHLDLATVKARLEEGQYAECPSKFYRDLLLLATNAALFFPKRAPEHKAAIELRQFVSTKLPHHHPSKPAELPAKPRPLPTTQQARVKLELETPDQAPAEPTPILKPKLLNPVIVCRKRSSVVMKPLSGEKKRDDSSSNTNDAKEKGKDKLASGGKGAQLEKLAWFGAVTKKRTRDQSAGSRSSGPKLSGNKSSSDAPSSKEGSGDETATAKLQKKKNDKEKSQDNSSNAGTSVGGKKKSVTNFLNRIRRSSADSSDSLKSSPNANSKTNSKGGEARKNSGSKSEAAASKGSSPASAKEKGKQKEAMNDEGSKRNLGRPPKRAAAMAGAVKRRRDGGGDKAEGAAPKKRSRK